MLMGVASDALITRRRLLERVMNKGLLPALSFGSDNVSSDAMPLVMNLVGLEEALFGLSKDAAPGGQGGPRGEDPRDRVAVGLREVGEDASGSA